MIIKLYTPDFANAMLKQFDDISDNHKLFGSMAGFPMQTSLKSLQSDDRMLIVTPQMPNGVLFEDQDNDILKNVIYSFDAMIFVKLGTNIWVWQDRTKQGAELTNKISEWADSIEDKIFIDSYNRIKSAGVRSLDYFNAKYMTEDLVQSNFVAVAVEVVIETVFNMRVYQDLNRRKD